MTPRTRKRPVKLAVVKATSVKLPKALTDAWGLPEVTLHSDGTATMEMADVEASLGLEAKHDRDEE